MTFSNLLYDARCFMAGQTRSDTIRVAVVIALFCAAAYVAILAVAYFGGPM